MCSFSGFQNFIKRTSTIAANAQQWKFTQQKETNLDKFSVFAKLGLVQTSRLSSYEAQKV